MHYDEDFSRRAGVRQRRGQPHQNEVQVIP